MGLVIIFLSSWLAVSAADCPTQKSLPPRPVHDQDGLGTCASNTAALMMQHNLGLEKSPSYIQLSVTTSGLKHDQFFKNDDEGNRRIFNWGALVCDVVNEAKDSGFCDYDQLGFDFVGAQDSLQSQQRLLERLATFFDANGSDIRNLREQLSDPQSRAEAQRRLAYFFQHNEQQCRTPLLEFMARRMLARHKVTLEGFVASGTNPQKTAARNLLRTLFASDGTPVEEAVAMALNFFNSQNLTESALLRADESNAPGVGLSGGPNENLMLSWWAIPRRININPLIGSLARDNFLLSDYRAYGSCRSPEQVRSLEDYLVAPLCVVPPDAGLSQPALTQAQQLLNTVQQMAQGRLDMQAGLVNIISPSCAAQMRQRGEDSFRERCGNQEVSSASTARRAKELITAEICENRAAAISLCTGFFRSATPVDSRFCSNDTAGVEGHGRHAVTAIGYRPGANGKQQFFLQNSWGASCPFLQHPGGFPETLQGLAECEVDSGGRPTGRFWVDEDLLLNNTYLVNTLKP